MLLGLINPSRRLLIPDRGGVDSFYSLSRRRTIAIETAEHHQNKTRAFRSILQIPAGSSDKVQVSNPGPILHNRSRKRW